MRVFVTGASGHLGSAIVPELVGAGHDVVGLARSDQAERTVIALGATAHRGDLDDLDGLAKAAADADGVIHLAFDHDRMRTGDWQAALAADLAVLHALGDALAGTGSTLDRHGFARTLIAIARQAGLAGYPGDGTTRWAAGHTLDVAHLYRLALENAPPAPAGTRPGTRASRSGTSPRASATTWASPPKASRKTDWRRTSGSSRR